MDNFWDALPFSLCLTPIDANLDNKVLYLYCKEIIKKNKKNYFFKISETFDSFNTLFEI